MQLYPLFLKLAGRRVLVVGAGGVAERKIRDLVAAGARVVVVAPEATEVVRAMAKNGDVEWRERPFAAGDAEGAWLVIAATRDAATQRAAAEAAEARGVFTVAVDDLPNGTAYSAAVVRRDPYVIAISSSGETPALTRLLRELLEQILPDAGWVEAARALRERWRKDNTPIESRFAELVRAFKERAR